MSWLTWPFRALGFLIWYAGQIISSSTAVLRDNLTPGQNSTPGVARVRTRCRSDLEVTLLAALITLTPGALTLGMHDAPVAAQRRRDAEDIRTLYVHSLYSGNADSVRVEVRGLETRLLRAVRRTGGTS